MEVLDWCRLLSVPRDVLCQLGGTPCREVSLRGNSLCHATNLPPSLSGRLRFSHQIRKGRSLEACFDLFSEVLPLGMQWAGIAVVAHFQAQNASADLIGTSSRCQNLRYRDRSCGPGQFVSSTYSLKGPNQFFFAELSQDLPKKRHRDFQTGRHFSGSDQLSGWLSGQVSECLDCISRGSREHWPTSGYSLRVLGLRFSSARILHRQFAAWSQIGNSAENLSQAASLFTHPMPWWEALLVSN
jgi:hypothetical protein